MLIRRTLFFIISVLLVWLNANAQKKANASIDVLHYKFEVHLEDTTDQVRINASIVFSLGGENFESIIFDLANKADSSEYGMQLHEVMLNGSEVNYSHQLGTLTILKPAFVNTTDTVTLQIGYSGMPEQGLVIGKNKFGERTFFAEHWPNRASYWLPVVDHPSEKATCEFIVTAPDRYSVVANGDLVNIVSKQGYKTTHWSEKTAIPAKVMVIGVANFKTRVMDKDSLITLWLYPEDEVGGIKDFEKTPKIFSFLSDYLGTYPYSKLDQVESSTKFGGMENAGNIFYPDTRIGKNRPFNTTIVHEIAHQWFGNSATESDWEHVWLSEGFATFFGYLYTEYTEGIVALKEKFDTDESSVRAYQESNPTATILQRSYNETADILNPLTYQKAGRVLWMLKHDVGDSIMQKIINNYYQKYQYSNAESQDFITIVKETTGKDYGPFFEQWLEKPGLINVIYSWKYKKGQIILLIEQKGSIVHKFGLDVEIKFDSMKTKVKKTKVTERSQKIVIPLDEKPTDLSLDPLNVILGELKKK